MQMYTISKEFTIDYAHRLLLPYDSLCNNLHGHTGKVILSLAFNELNNQQMLVDFNELKPFIDKIKNKYDHSTLINKKDTDLLEFCKSHNYKHIVFDDNPTSETISKHIAYNLYYEYGKLLDKKKWIISVKFYETPTSSAKYTFTSSDIVNIFNCDKKIETNNESKKDPITKNRILKDHFEFINRLKKIKKDYYRNKMKKDSKKEEIKKEKPNKKDFWKQKISCKIIPDDNLSEVEVQDIISWANKIDFTDFEQVMKAIKNAPKFIQEASNIQIKIKTED